MNILTKALSKVGIISVTEVPVEEQQEVSAPTVIAQIQQSPIIVQGTSAPSVQGQQITQEQMQKFEEHFNKLFNDANLPGPDYHEFLTMTDSFESAGDGIPENTVFKSVFKALGAQGLTKEYLLSTAAQYIDVINKDSVNFNGAIEAKVNEQVGGRIQKNEDLKKSILEKQELIAGLQQDIIDCENTIKVNEQEILTAQQTIGSNSQAYNIACNALKSKISEDITKIQTII